MTRTPRRPDLDGFALTIHCPPPEENHVCPCDDGPRALDEEPEWCPLHDGPQPLDLDVWGDPR